MTREQTIKSQLQAMGTYDAAFDAEIHILAGMERDLRSAQKLWREQTREGGSKFESESWPVIERLRKDILTHYDALGLTPKGMKRLRAAGTTDPTDPQSVNAAFSSVMDDLKRVAAANAGGANGS